MQRSTLHADQTLTIHQTSTCRTPGYRSAETAALTHVKGATALLDLRGEKQLDSELGRALFVQARGQIVTGCYQTHSHVPDVVVQLSQNCHDSMIDPLGGVFPSVSSLCDMKAQLPFTPPASQSEYTTRAGIARYSAISQAYTEWHDSALVGFLPSAIFKAGPDSEAITEHYHVYENIWIAAFSNNYRANCILLHEALISQLLFLQANYARNMNEVLELQDQIGFSRRIILSFIHDICASVPDLLRSGFAAAGVGLLWILFLIAQLSPEVAPLPDATRQWIIGRLEKIGTEMGVQQAIKLAERLREEIERPNSRTGKEEDRLLT